MAAEVTAPPRRTARVAPQPPAPPRPVLLPPPPPSLLPYVTSPDGPFPGNTVTWPTTQKALIKEHTQMASLNGSPCAVSHSGTHRAVWSHFGLNHSKQRSTLHALQPEEREGTR